MVVRIRLERGSPARKLKGPVRRVAIVCAALLTPAALMAWALGGWRLMADFKWTGDFAISDGIFSHWQVWVAIAIVVQFVAFILSRAGGQDDDNFDPPARHPAERRARAGGR